MDFEEVTAVVFDLDGTLCRYTVSIEKAITEALKRGGCSCELVGDCAQAAARYKELWHQEALIHDVDWPLRERLWRQLLEENGTNDIALARALAEHYTQIRVPEICLFSGVHELLVDLKRCYRLGLLTNGPTDMQW
ncbi:HAD family hydrolase, partial [Candidatus Bipolaricaulota bacterium]|nr:HAD family hydrolase [Candidatus Bipolaricaulota bacterium]